MALTKAKVSFVEGVDGAVLTGAMPAVDGASLTGIAGMTKTTSDPLITSNPATGVGTVWLNKSTSELFGCTDATTDENVWVNIGGGAGYVHDASSFQGEIAGFISSGHGGGAYTNNIFRFSFIQDGNATDHGDLSKIRYQASGSSSSTHGYTCGGYGPNPGLSASRNEIDRFAFSSSSNATQVGTLSATKRRCSGQSSSTHGYNSGGDAPPPVDLIEKYSFASSSTVSNVGTMTIAKASCAGQNSSTHGYNSGGTFVDGVPQPYNVIDNFPFASDTNATDVGNLTVSKVGGNGGCSSTTNGYHCGGYLPAPVATTRVIEKFSFASTNNASNIANLLTAQTGVTGTSAVNYGYVCGGGSSNNEIQKFTFAADADSTDVGDLVLGMEQGCGQQF